MTMTRSPRHNRGTLALAALATCCSALANNRRFSEDPVGSACNINDGHIQEAGGMSRDQIVTDSASPRILNTPAQYVELNAATCIAGLQGMASAPQGITSMTTPAAAEINVGETSVGELAAANVALGLGGASAVSRMAV